MIKILKKHISKNKVYIPIIFQIAFGFFVLSIFLNLSLSIKQEYNNLINEGKELEYYIYAQYKDDITKFYEEKRGAKEIPFDIKIIENINTSFKNISCIIEGKTEIMILEESEVVFYDVIGLSNYSTVGFSQKTSETLQKKGAVFQQDEFPFKIANNKLMSDEAKEYDIKIIPDDYVIYLPIELYSKLYHPINCSNTKLKINITNSQEVLDTLNEIIITLSTNNNEFIYTMGNELYDYIKKTNTAYNQSKIFNLIAMILIAIITIGTSGIFVSINMSKKNENAIYIALGATKTYLIIKNLIKIYLICFIGALIGVIGSTVLIGSGVAYATVKISFSVKTVILLLALTIIITLIAMIPTFAYINRFMPVKILKSD